MPSCAGEMSQFQPWLEVRTQLIQFPPAIFLMIGLLNLSRLHIAVWGLFALFGGVFSAIPKPRCR